MAEKTIRIKLLRHRPTGLLMAVSDDLKGLAIHGRTVAEIDERIPSIVRDLLEAEGFKVTRLDIVEDKSLDIADFGPPAYLANVSLRSAA